MDFRSSWRVTDETSVICIFRYFNLRFSHVPIPLKDLFLNPNFNTIGVQLQCWRLFFYLI